MNLVVMVTLGEGSLLVLEGGMEKPLSNRESPGRSVILKVLELTQA